VQAFQSFINANPRAPEFLSLFIDEHLKKGTKSVSHDKQISRAHANGQKTDDEIDLALEKTIILFRFLIDKDKFERYYKNHLSRRLLYARSASDDAEKGMVAKLKLEMCVGLAGTCSVKLMIQGLPVHAEARGHVHGHAYIG
jgi:cullin 3